MSTNKVLAAEMIILMLVAAPAGAWKGVETQGAQAPTLGRSSIRYQVGIGFSWHGRPRGIS